MDLPPFAAPQGFQIALQPDGEGEERWFIFSKNALLVSEDKKSVPTIFHLKENSSLYLGKWHETHCLASQLKNDIAPPKGYIFCELIDLFFTMSSDLYSIAGRALQLLHWENTHRFCGKCGSPTFHREHERCLECSECKHLNYPKMAPAIMALVRKDDKILLARSPHFPKTIYSVLAGFVDPGETLEQCVEREVFEEVGILVKNIQYFGSQPWPFSYSLMLGFTCDWAEGEIKMDPQEIEDAAWFSPTELPPLSPPLSLSRMLIDSQVVGSPYLA